MLKDILWLNPNQVNSSTTNKKLLCFLYFNKETDNALDHMQVVGVSLELKIYDSNTSRLLYGIQNYEIEQMDHRKYMSYIVFTLKIMHN